MYEYINIPVYGDYMYNNYYIPVEFWKPITEDIIPDVKPYYWISNLGRVFSTINNTFKAVRFAGHGYYITDLALKSGKAKTTYIHRLVLSAFNPVNDFENLQVNHIDGLKTTNYEGNLEWMTPEENNLHAKQNNLNNNCGTGHYRHGFSDEVIHQTCKLISQNYDISFIAYELRSQGVINDNMETIITKIRDGKYFPEISSLYGITPYIKEIKTTNFTDDQVHIICKAIDNGIIYCKDILKIIGIDISTLSKNELGAFSACIYRIKHGFSYTHISKYYNFNQGSTTIETDQL